MEERVQKFISSAGVASRREAESFIKSGQVFINGRKAKLGDKVNPDVDVVKVYGKIVKPAERKIYLMLNKPKGYVVTKKDPLNRKTIYTLLPKELGDKVWNVGRLDFNTEGLIILTNDGDLTQQLAHPKFEHEKEYEATVQETPTENQLQRLRGGITIDTGKTYPAEVSARGNVISLIVHEGKNRQIRKMLEAVGLTVLNLKRIGVNNLALPQNLSVGKYREVNKDEII